jgi:hypothetical protein
LPASDIRSYHHDLSTSVVKDRDHALVSLDFCAKFGYLAIVKVGVSAFGIIATDPPDAVPSPYDTDLPANAAAAPEATAATLVVNASNNTITFGGPENTATYGIRAYGGYGPDNLDLTINGNEISGFARGIDFWQCQSGCSAGVFTSVVANNNCLAGNDYGMRSNVTYLTVDGRNNWWGDDSGPYNAATNPGGLGSEVSANVDFVPWVTGSCGSTTLVATELSASTDDALFCTDETTDVFIDLAAVAQLYGYQFEVSYDQTKASAVGAFVNSFFDTTPPVAIPTGYGAVCSAGVCKFGASHISTSAQQSVSGSGPLAKITLTGVAPGTFSMVISDDLLTTIDGDPITHDLGAPLPMTVCGLANISGYVTLQGRSGNNVDAGTVSLLEQGTNFTPPGVTPVAFSDSNGYYSFTGVPFMPGGSSYEIVAEHGLYLDNQEIFTLSGNVSDKNTRLWGGDANNDGNVTISDLSCIGGDFGGSPGTCGGLGTSTDINADGRVNIQDLAIAGGNFDKCGAQPWAWQTDSPVFCPPE